MTMWRAFVGDWDHVAGDAGGRASLDEVRDTWEQARDLLLERLRTVGPSTCSDEGCQACARGAAEEIADLELRSPGAEFHGWVLGQDYRLMPVGASAAAGGGGS